MSEIWKLWYTEEFLKLHRALMERMKDAPDNAVCPCPRCEHGYLINEGEKQGTDGQFDWVYACDSCDYHETL